MLCYRVIIIFKQQRGFQQQQQQNNVQPNVDYPHPNHYLGHVAYNHFSLSSDFFMNIDCSKNDLWNYLSHGNLPVCSTFEPQKALN